MPLLDIVGITAPDEQHRPPVGRRGDGRRAHGTVAAPETLQVEAPAIDAVGVAPQATQEELHYLLLAQVGRHQPGRLGARAALSCRHRLEGGKHPVVVRRIVHRRDIGHHQGRYPPRLRQRQLHRHLAAQGVPHEMCRRQAVVRHPGTQRSGHVSQRRRLQPA